jgi:hypothetical protein
MEYEKNLEMKIVRTQHKITLFRLGSAGSLKKVLQYIPDDAVLIEEEETPAGFTVLIFQKEERI